MTVEFAVQMTVEFAVQMAVEFAVQMTVEFAVQMAVEFAATNFAIYKWLWNLLCKWLWNLLYKWLWNYTNGCKIMQMAVEFASNKCKQIVRKFGVSVEFALMTPSLHTQITVEFTIYKWL